MDTCLLCLWNIIIKSEVNVCCHASWKVLCFVSCKYSHTVQQDNSVESCRDVIIQGADLVYILDQ